MSTTNTDDMVTIDRKKHTNHDVYWVELHRTDGSILRAFPTYTMTDACILQEELVAWAQGWAAQI
jgi:hypothetical protein